MVCLWSSPLLLSAMQHQPSAQLGGKGTVRRKVKRHSQPGQNQKKQLQEIMKKMGANQIQKSGTVNLYKDNGKVLTSSDPTVDYAQQGHVFSISGGKWVEKSLNEMIPDALDGLNPEALQAFQKLQESFQNQSQLKKNVEEVPDLVEEAAELD